VTVGEAVNETCTFVNIQDPSAISLVSVSAGGQANTAVVAAALATLLLALSGAAIAMRQRAVKGEQ
jgi:hypothetical protein